MHASNGLKILLRAFWYDIMVVELERLINTLAQHVVIGFAGILNVWGTSLRCQYLFEDGLMIIDGIPLQLTHDFGQNIVNVVELHHLMSSSGHLVGRLAIHLEVGRR